VRIVAQQDDVRLEFSGIQEDLIERLAEPHATARDAAGVGFPFYGLPQLFEPLQLCVRRRRRRALLR
jgi:hypothetical protein